MNSYVVEGVNSKSEISLKNKSLILELIFQIRSKHFTQGQVIKVQHYSKKCKFNHTYTRMIILLNKIIFIKLLLFLLNYYYYYYYIKFNHNYIIYYKLFPTKPRSLIRNQRPRILRETLILGD